MTTTQTKAKVGGAERICTDYREVAIELIMLVHGRERPRAESEIHFAERLVERARQCDYDCVMPTQGELDSNAYRDFCADVAHGQMSETGSIHRAIEKAVLNPELGEHSLVHDLTGFGTGQQFCGVYVVTHAVT